MQIKTKCTEYAKYALKYATYAHTHTQAYRRTPFLYYNKKYDIICTQICKICTHSILVQKVVKYEKNAKICLVSPAYPSRVGLVLQNKKYA
jgi:hypothetical protein